MERLKHELQMVESKIKMQADALDVVTAEREDLQGKLNKALDEIVVYKGLCHRWLTWSEKDWVYWLIVIFIVAENVSSLRDQLSESLNCQKELGVAIAELKQFKEDTSARDLALE